MFFASPLWLFGLIPWTALAVWMLWGKRPAAVVPFIDLWRGPVTGKYVERSVHPPPRAIVMILLAALLAIVAAAGPALREKGARRLSIVVDRGVTMSALGRERPRFVETSEDARAGLMETLRESRFTPDDVRVIVVPNGGPHTSRLDDWTSLVSHLPPTAADTRNALVAAVALERGERDAVVVVSDQSVVPIGDNIVQISPADTPSNVGIALIAARESPAGQVMVRVRNDSPLAGAKLVVATAGERTERDVELPAPGGEADVFVDLPRVGDVIHARLEAKDSLPADNEAWLARERSWPRVEARATLPAALAKMIEVYSRTRPPADGARRVAVVTDEKALAADEIGAIVANSAAKSRQVAADAAPAVVDHAIVRNVAWANVLKGANVAPAPAGSTPVVSIAGQPVVAVRDGDVRRVWIGFHSASFARSTDYVVFWTNVFDWLGQGGETFAAHPVEPLGDEWEPAQLAAGAPTDAKWWPGLYKRKGDRALRAVNAPAPRIEPAVDVDWRALLHGVADARERGGGVPLAPWLLVAAVACLAAAGWWWPGRGLTRFSGGRTV